jgi:chromosome segregation ATPase
LTVIADHQRRKTVAEKQKKSALARVLGFFWALIKLILVLAVIAALGVGIYWGGYYAYWGIVSPIASNTNAINLLQDDLGVIRDELGQELAAQLAAQNQKIAQLSTQMADSEERMAGLEEKLVARDARMAEFEEELAARDARLKEALVDRDQRIVDLQSELSTQSKRVASYEEQLAGLKDRLDAGAAQMADLEEALVDRDQRIADLVTELSSQGERIADLNADLAEIEAEVARPEEEIARLKLQALLLKASQEAIKAHIHLIENNAGTAQEELGLVKDSLEDSFALGDEEAQAAISELQDRLADVMRDIKESPFTATGELEILWRGIDALIGP